MILEEAYRADRSPGGATPMGAAPVLWAPDPPAQPIPLTGTLPDIKGTAHKSPQGLPACWERKYQTCLEIKQQSQNRGKKRKKKPQETKPKLTPFVIENSQCGEPSLGGQHAFCRGNPK